MALFVFVKVVEFSWLTAEDADAPFVERDVEAFAEGEAERGSTDVEMLMRDVTVTPSSFAAGASFASTRHGHVHGHDGPLTGKSFASTAGKHSIALSTPNAAGAPSAPNARGSAGGVGNESFSMNLMPGSFAQRPGGPTTPNVSFAQPPRGTSNTTTPLSARSSRPASRPRTEL